jgi:hypothetical protein
VENKKRGVFAGLLNAGVEVVFFPGCELLRFARGKAGFHREIRAREIERVLVVRAHANRGDYADEGNRAISLREKDEG